MQLTDRQRLTAAAVAIALIAGAGGYAIATYTGSTSPGGREVSGRRVLYWYDPMVPSQHFDKSGKSPFMDMQLVPRYADEATAAPGVAIDPARTQALGMRTATAEIGTLEASLTAAGSVDFNQRDVAIVQARSGGFVQRVYARAPGDYIGAGATLADLLIPEWGGAQAEFLAVRRTGDKQLITAARQRLALLGMPSGVIATVERSGRQQNVLSITTPAGGVIKTLGVRAGMTVSQGQTLAEINGIATVWLNAAIPEAMAGRLRPGQPASATLAAYPGERFPGRISAILPDVQAQSRTLTARIELANRGGRLRPGMFAQVEFGGAARQALLVPDEALIRTGRRTLVMLALPQGRYQAAEVQTGESSGGKTEVIAGLAPGEKVIVSGQFLIESEASLAGLQSRPITPAQPKVSSTPGESIAQGVGTITAIDPKSVTISHGPIPAAKWPAMTMRFLVPSKVMGQGLKRGDRVRFSFDQPSQGPTVRQIEKVGDR